MPPKPHPMAKLLGRIPSPPDPRDFKLRLWTSTNPLEQALAAMLASKSAAKVTKDWCQIATPLIIGGQPAPVPVPSAQVMWVDNEPVLDQGDTGHCVGFAGAGWGNVLPQDDHFVNSDGDRIYYEACAAGGYPNTEDGSTIRDLAKALKKDGRLSVYAFAASVDDALSFVSKSGPVVFGTDWTEGMFDPDPTGRVRPTGQVAGGHAYVCIGLDLQLEQVWFLNSWSVDWGQNGRFWMSRDDVQTIFANQGEAMAAVELPTSAAEEELAAAA